MPRACSAERGYGRMADTVVCLTLLRQAHIDSLRQFLGC
jgi:hypothetical protein